MTTNTYMRPSVLSGDEEALIALAKQFNTHAHCFIEWVDTLLITQAQIEYALAMFDKRQRFELICRKFQPQDYFIDYPLLLKPVWEMSGSDVKGLQPSIYSAHLSQLRQADDIDDKTSGRAFPYQQYDADAFIALRNITKKADEKFVRQLFRRSISHHTYPAAKQKLKNNG